MFHLEPMYLSPETNSDQSHYDFVVAHKFFYYGATGFVMFEVDCCNMACSSSTYPKIPGSVSLLQNVRHPLNMCQLRKTELVLNFVELHVSRNSNACTNTSNIL